MLGINLLYNYLNIIILIRLTLFKKRLLKNNCFLTIYRWFDVGEDDGQIVRELFAHSSLNGNVDFFLEI